MKRAVLVAVTLTVVAAGATIRAHHSFAATYEESKTVKIEGKLVQFLFRNPHSFVHVMANDDSGQEQRWAVEWGGVGQLAGQGVTRETLKPGDVVVITGNPGRNAADHRIRMVTLTRPSDGFTWGNRPGQVVE
jgi:thiamine monophosphate kinase